MSLPAREWNKLCAWLARHAHPLPGLRCRIARHADGVTVSPDRAAFFWRHPWHVVPAWDAKAKTWHATIRPGFVNGIAPTVNGIPITSAHRLDLPLTQLPTPPPPFFASLGVRDPTAGIRLGGPSGVQIVDESWRDSFLPPPRRLAQCDISLSIARPALNGAPTLDAEGNLDFTPSLSTTLLDARGQRPAIHAQPIFLPPRPPSLLEKLLGTAADPQEDALLLATVFFLSPPNFDGPVNGDWTPYLRHACFWNLAHAARAASIPDPTPIRLSTGLVGGIFDGYFTQLLAPGNEAADRIAAAFAAQSHEGRFWTI